MAVETAEKRLAVAILTNREFGQLYFGCRTRPVAAPAEVIDSEVVRQTIDFIERPNQPGRIEPPAEKIDPAEVLRKIAALAAPDENRAAEPAGRELAPSAVQPNRAATHRRVGRQEPQGRRAVLVFPLGRRRRARS